MPPRLLTLYSKSQAQRSIGVVKTREVDEQAAQFVLPKRTLEELFPGVRSTDVSVPVSAFPRQDEWLLPPVELLTLGAICKHTAPRRIFEIGTYTGLTTLMMARNTSCEAEIFTLDLDPSQRETHVHGLGVGGLPAFEVGELYCATPFARKIHTLFGNSATFDFSPFYDSIDLVFIDADHTYRFVKADTENAFKMLRAGGTIIWDDYVWYERHPECAGVTRCLNELQKGSSIFRIDGTRVAIYIDPT